MGTTADGYPYPEGTDMLPDGDDAIQALAESINLYRATTAGAAFPPHDPGRIFIRPVT